MTKIITIGSFQGECGSSTLAANISYILANNNKKILLIDLNPNMGLTRNILFTQWKYEEIEQRNKILKNNGDLKGFSKKERYQKQKEVETLIEQSIDINYYLEKAKRFDTSLSFFNPEIVNNAIKFIHLDKTLDFLPSHPKVMYLNPNTRGETLKQYLIKNKLTERYDFIIIDGSNIPLIHLRLALFGSSHFLYILYPTKMSIYDIELLNNYYIPDYEKSTGMEFPKTRIIPNLVNIANKKILNQKIIQKYESLLINNASISKNAVINHLQEHKRAENRFLPLTLNSKSKAALYEKINNEFSTITNFLIDEE